MIAAFLRCAFGLRNADTQRDFNNYCMKSFYVHNFDAKSCIVIFSIRILTKELTKWVTYKNMTMAWGQYGKTGGDSKIDGIKIDRVLDPPKWRHAKTR